MERMIKVFDSEIKDIDDKEMSLTALISTNTIDRHGEVLDPAGLDVKNFSKNPVVLWAHNYELPPIGKAMWVRRKDGGVISKVKFANTPFAQEIFQLYKEGFMKAFSVGFMPKDYEEGDGKKTPRRTYTKWELLEYSAVPVPANPDAVSMAIKKGILKTESIIKSLGEETMQEFNHEGITEDEFKEKTLPKENTNGLEELQAENKRLEEENCYLRKESAEIKFKYLEVLTKNQEKQSEIAVNNLAGIASEIIDGAIRKAQGKV